VSSLRNNGRRRISEVFMNIAIALSHKKRCVVFFVPLRGWADEKPTTKRR
jgi:hypothetical protein